MNKVLLSIISLTAAGYTLAACQSDTYRIKGTGDALRDGDTLYITNDMMTGKPIDTVVVKEGVFETEGTTDSTAFCMIYSKRNNMMMPFFIEPGTIKLRLSKNGEKSEVTGTTVNDKWQNMADSIYTLSKKMQETATRVYRNELGNDEQEKQKAAMDKLNEDFKGLVLKNAEENTDNEFGYFILTYYTQGIIAPETHMRLISEMPEKMRNRPAVQTVLKQLETESATAEGSRMKDFSMNGIDGKPMSIMQEIGRNKITIIDFWASWCGPCRNEMPHMVALYDKYKAKGLGIVGISLDNKQKDWETATKTLGIKWPQMSDLKGWDNAAARMFNIRSIPQVIVVDQKGVILKKGLRGEALEKFVGEKLK